MAAIDFLSQGGHIIAGIYPAADVVHGSPSTDYIYLRDYRRIGFVVFCGDSTGDDSDGVITMHASDGTNTENLDFNYRTCLSSTTVDTWSAIAAGTTSGVTMTGDGNEIYYVEVSVEDIMAECQAASTSFEPTYCYLTLTEDSDDPTIGCVLVLAFDGRYPQPVPMTAIA